jgi:hypothetical protein
MQRLSGVIDSEMADVPAQYKSTKSKARRPRQLSNSGLQRNEYLIEGICHNPSDEDNHVRVQAVFEFRESVFAR